MKFKINGIMCFIGIHKSVSYFDYKNGYSHHHFKCVKCLKEWCWTQTKSMCFKSYSHFEKRKLSKNIINRIKKDGYEI